MINEDIGFSLWLDFIERDFLKNDFIKMVEEGRVNGATSNPSIFANALSNSPAYKEALNSLEGLSPKEKYEALAIDDIKQGAIVLRGVYEQGSEGYISIEVDPFLANDTQGSIEEGRRLFKAIGEPNVMIKIPATEAGFPAMKALLSEGISVNATLVFSPKQARKCLDAMIEGIAEFENSGGERVEAVISVFVSRFDRMLDWQLETKDLPVAQTGVMNASKIYSMVESNNTPAIRTLFASTGVKSNQPLEADYYIRSLYGSHCVNTAPLETIEAFEANGECEVVLPRDSKEIEEYFKRLEANGIDMDLVYNQLLEEGLVAFEESFTTMLRSLEQ